MLREFIGFEMSGLSILVTGGFGFIGSNIASHLARNGHNVTVSDCFGCTEKWRNIGTGLVDIILPADLPALLASTQFDLVIHMGAISATTERDVDLIVRANINLTLQLLDYCTKRSVRFIYASSAATYGDGQRGFDDENTSAAIALLKPLNAYGWSKNNVDFIIATRRERNLPLPAQCVGLKFFNVFGPKEYHKGDMSSVVLKIFEQLKTKKAVTLFKSHRKGVSHGGQKRDFIYVKDTVDVVAWLVENPSVSGLFNVGTGNARSFLDLGTAVFAALGRRPEITFIPMPAAIREKYQYFTEASTERLRKAGYTKPFTSLEDGVQDYVVRFLKADPYGDL